MHVEVVVGRCSVGTDTEQDAGIHHLVNLRNATAQFQVRARIQNSSGTSISHERHIVLCQMDTVSCYQVVIQNSIAVQKFHRRTTILLFAVANFLDRFGQMRMKHHPLFVSNLGTTFKEFLAHQINGVRHYHKLHAFRFMAMITDKLHVLFDTTRSAQVFGNSHTNGSTNTHFFNHLHGVFAMPVHIGKKHRARLNHLKHR